MITKCKECGLQVSDKAYSCPHCGNPMKISTLVKPKKKRTRLPNGFGRITSIKDERLRNPYRAMVTVSKNQYGQPIGKILGYYKTYNDAYVALAEYNLNPYDLNKGMTVKELYVEWSEEYFKTLKAKSSERTIISAWAYCSSVENINARDIRPKHIKACMDSTESPNIKSRIKSIFNLMLDYALENEIVDKNYARTFNISENIKKETENTLKPHIAFTNEEVKKLWENINIPYTDIVIIQCYTGFRPQELGLIELTNVDLDKGTIIGGMKTDAGTNRVVPIHDLIYDLVKARYDEAVDLNSKYLFNCIESNNMFMSYDKYRNRFDNVMAVLNITGHRAHDARKTFVTMAKKAEMNEYAIKKIIGHSISDITESKYTDRDRKWLKKEMSRISMY